MKKYLIISLILFLILFTAFIKNSSKRMDDEIFAIKENISILKKEFNNLKLEYTYLSSGKKLIDLKSKFFIEDLKFKKKDEIKILIHDKEKIIVRN